VEYATEGAAARTPVVSGPDRLAVPSDLVARTQPVNLAASQRFEVSDTFRPLLPDGLPRGTTVSVVTEHRGAEVVEGSPPGWGTTSLALGLVARASQDGAWLGVLGSPQLGLVAAHESGVCLERLVLVEEARGESLRQDVATIAAAMVDGFDLVLLGRAAWRRLGRRDSRRLVSRVRERSGALVCIGGDLPGEPARTRLSLIRSEWSGLEEGAGHLRSRRVAVERAGRGAASHPRQAELWLPGPPP
jgi:hypothetical protein